ncbi:MAG: type III-B CRISPR module-associated protein Cmr3 [Fusobacteriaceae bacterium]|jgi:CRISPR-associated protein Cmr3|nr:type III-B CRISPR module-associated protein Cmr3 [Fusobacteriaceae bacterium]
MAKKLIKLTPLEPYFLGGERIFEINDGNKHYFIRSLETPSQTTLFGALRFLGIQKVSNTKTLSEEDKANIGNNSFDLEVEHQSFGRINSISPLYLIDNDNKFYVRTPFDHKAGSFDERTETYTAFEFADKKITDRGERLFPKKNEFNAKDGVADSWMSLDGSTVLCNLFEGVVKVGIDKSKKKKAFVKKEYKRLKKGFSFAFFADVDSNFKFYQNEIFLGQGKSSFSVTVDECKELTNDILAAKLRSDMVYAQSDIYCSGDPWKMCLFSAIETRDFRVFTTKYEQQSSLEQYQKHDNHIKLIRAGSVFIPKEGDIDKFRDIIENYAHAKIAGFNQIIIGGTKK